MERMSDDIIRENPHTRLNIFSITRPPHAHTFYEFAVVVEGKCMHSMNGGKYIEMNKGSFVIIRPCDSHKFEFLDKTGCYRDFYVSQEKMEQICKTFGENFFNDFNNYKEIPVMNLTLDEFNMVESKSRYFNRFDIDTNKISSELEHMHTLIISTLLCKLFENQIKSASVAPQWLEELYLRLTYFDFIRLSLEEIIQKIGFSHSYICHMFKKHYNTTLIAYHNRSKVIYSCNYLRTFKIIDISTMLGWDNPKNYANEFKKVFGLSPKQYIMHNKKQEYGKIY